MLSALLSNIRHGCKCSNLLLIRVNYKYIKFCNFELRLKKIYENEMEKVNGKGGGGYSQNFFSMKT
jgi:hypothetical protein